MTSSIRLRAPTVADAQSIATLSGELGYEVTTDVMAVRIAKLLARDDYHLVVAVMDGEISGWIQVTVFESLESGCRAEIVGLVVSAKFRRKGIGSMMVDDAIRWAKNRKAEVLVVRSNVVRKESHQFYPSVGFELTKTQAIYRSYL